MIGNILSKILQNPFYDKRFFRTFLATFALNFIVLFFSHYIVLQAHFDMYYMLSFIYRIIMFFVSYIALFYLIYLLHFYFLQNFLLGIILLGSVVCYVVEIFLLYTFDTPLNSYLIIVFLETNLQESIEFLHTYFNLTFCLICIASFLVVWGIYRLNPPPLHTLRSLKWIYAFLFLLVIGAHVAHLRPSSPMLRYSDILYHTFHSFHRALSKTQAFIEEYKTLNAKFDSLSSTLQVEKAENPIDNIVLIIGESTQRNKLSLYGYPLPTTPLLDQLKHTKPENLIVFNDVIAPHAQTHESLSLSLTFANQDSQGIATLQDETSQSTQKEWYEYLNIIDAFKLGGYETLSISNQEGVSLFGNAAASILKRADRVEFVNVGDSLDLTKHDGALLPMLQLYLSPPPTENRFIVLHLMGSHARYESRYPVDFKYFHSENVIAPTFAHKSTLAAYLNSVLYGDFVISEIIKQFKDSDSLVLFLSDHGEEVYDFRDFIGHSDSKISRFMVEIPFIIYVSDTFINKHPMLYERIQQAKDQRYMNDDLIHTLLDIAGISLKGYEPQRSIISLDKSLLDKRMRKVGDKSNLKDYDKELMQIPTPKQENLEH